MDSQFLSQIYPGTLPLDFQLDKNQQIDNTFYAVTQGNLYLLSLSLKLQIWLLQQSFLQILFILSCISSESILFSLWPYQINMFAKLCLRHKEHQVRDPSLRHPKASNIQEGLPRRVQARLREPIHKMHAFSFSFFFFFSLTHMQPITNKRRRGGWVYKTAGSCSLQSFCRLSVFKPRRRRRSNRTWLLPPCRHVAVWLVESPFLFFFFF